MQSTSSPSPAILAPFRLRNLTVIAYANGFTLWHYRVTEGSILQVLESGFFADGRDLIAYGDQIHISAPDGAALGVFSTCGNAPQLLIMSKVIF